MRLRADPYRSQITQGGHNYRVPRLAATLPTESGSDLADVLGFNFTDVLAPADELKACPADSHHAIRILLFVRVGVY